MFPQAGHSLITLALIYGLAASPAFADARKGIDPPARFDHPNSNLLILRFTPAEVRNLCHGYDSCAMVGDGHSRCWIMFPNTGKNLWRLMRHESAHCNGWPANHPK